MLVEQKQNKTIRPPSVYTLSAEETNQITTELENVITRGNLTPSAASTSQVADAIENMINPDKWQKPDSWIDIRSGALPNSMYFLVAHSADYATYPQFSVIAQIQNSGTYDVYVDGIKYATTNHNTTTTIDWQTLAPVSGYDVTHPSALRTHIVRVTPSSDSNAITAIHLTSNTSVNQGVLWLHLTVGNMDNINLRNLMGDEGGTYKCPILEVCTSTSNTIAGGQFMFINCAALKSIPTVIKGYAGNNLSGAFRSTSLEKIHFKNCDLNIGYFTFAQSNKLKKITAENSIFKSVFNSVFSQCPKLEYIDIPFSFGTMERSQTLFYRCSNLKGPIFLDATDGTSLKSLTLGGESTYRLDAIKGVTVSPNAPFNYSNSPQIDVSYTGLSRVALINLFNSMPTVSDSQVCNITGATGASDLTAADLAIATGKGWTITR